MDEPDQGRRTRVLKPSAFATDLLIFAVKDDPSILVGHVRRPEIGTASVRLEGTYVIRVFAEFENVLRHFILAFHIRRPRAAETLINRVRDRGHIPQPMTDAVHRVREYRNILVHERLALVAPVTIETTRFLCTFLSRVQNIW